MRKGNGKGPHTLGWLSTAATVALLTAACGPSDPGARVWKRKCAACHGADGKGRTKYAAGRPYADLTDGVWKNGGDLASIRRLISEGDPKSPMPPYKDRLDPEEIDAVARYVEELARPPAATRAP